MAVRDEVVYGDWEETVVGSLDSAVRALLAAEDDDIDAAVAAAGHRTAVIAALPPGLRLGGSQFTGPAPIPDGGVVALRSAVGAVGVADVIVQVESDIQAARLLRVAVRRAEAEVSSLRGAQRANVRRRAAAGVPKTRIARDLGVQRVTVDAWLRTPATAEPARPSPSAASDPTPSGSAFTRGRDDDDNPEAVDAPRIPAEPVATHRPRRRGSAAPTKTRGPALLRFDESTVRLQPWPGHSGGWMVHADDPRGHAIMIGHITREDKLSGRTKGWQPLDEQRHRIGVGPLPKTRPAAVAEVLRAHEQRRASAARGRRID